MLTESNVWLQNAAWWITGSLGWVLQGSWNTPEICVFFSTSTTASVNWLPTIGLHTMRKKTGSNQSLPRLARVSAKKYGSNATNANGLNQQGKLLWPLAESVASAGCLFLHRIFRTSGVATAHVFRWKLRLQHGETEPSPKRLACSQQTVWSNVEQKMQNNHQMKWHYDAMMFIWLCTSWWHALGNEPNCLKEPPWRWNAESTALCMNDVVLVFICFATSD